jgi:RNA polymerase sigma factor (sigma-70 family)
MAKGRLGGVFRDVQTLLRAGTTGGLTDGHLLEEFRTRGGEARERAFASLVERHGPAVLRACRSILRDEHAAEDAFQAVFLVLARKAGSLRVRDSLAPWLHQVACRVAWCARASAARRRRHERTAAGMADPSACDAGPDDLGPLIHEEIDRLPGRYRAPIVLCFLEGLTREQAAGQLRWPLGTLQSRLARGRERLRERLIRRGAAPSAVLTGWIRSETARAVVPAALAGSTTRAALSSAAGRLAVIGLISAPSALTEEVLKAMWLHKLRMIAGGMIAGVILAAGAAATGAALVLQESRSGPLAVNEPHPAPAAEERGGTEVAATNPAPAEQAAAVLKYGDGKADGKQSLGGSGEMITFSATAAAARVKGLRIHGSRYGNPQPPDESFLTYFLNEDRTRILHTEMAPYSLFERGPEEWVEIAFDRPVELPKTFWVVLDFRANQTKGVFVSFDTSTGGRHSLTGLPGTPTAKPRRGGDWMIEAVLAE